MKNNRPILFDGFGLKILRASDVALSIQGEEPKALTDEELAMPAGKLPTSWEGTFDVEVPDLARMRSVLNEMHERAVVSARAQFDALLARVDNLVKVHAEIEYVGPVLRGYFDGTYVWMDGRSLQRILQLKLAFTHDEMRIDMFGPLAKKVKEGLDAQ